MLSPDDLYVSRWQKWREGVTRMDLDTLLRWALMANVSLVALFCVVNVLHLFGTWAATLLRFVSGAP